MFFVFGNIDGNSLVAKLGEFYTNFVSRSFVDSVAHDRPIAQARCVALSNRRDGGATLKNFFHSQRESS